MRTWLAALSVTLTFLTLAVWPYQCRSAEDEEHGAAFERVVVEAERIPVDNSLNMSDWSKDKAYYGLIDSQEGLDKLWSRQVSADKPYASRFGIGLPESPKVDFSKYSVIWFSDMGANSSGVDSVLVAAYATDKTMFVTFVALHSGPASKRLELWKVPLTGYRPEFDVLQKYD
jgi:hypothetical protein